jgi:hypothetical protein
MLLENLLEKAIGIDALLSGYHWAVSDEFRHIFC